MNAVFQSGAPRKKVALMQSRANPEAKVASVAE
jgi:hypothetical protein